VVVHEGKALVFLSSHAESVPQKPDCPPIPSRISRRARFRRPALASLVRAGTSDGNALCAQQQKRGRRERSPKQEYLSKRLCFWERGAGPYIGWPGEEGDEPGHPGEQ